MADAGGDRPAEHEHGTRDGRSIAEAKRALRREVLAARRHVDHDLHDEALLAALRAWLRDRPVDTVGAYLPMPGEPGGPRLPAVIAEAVPRVLLPVVLPDRDLDWALYRGTDGLARARLGLHEPTGPRLGRDAIRRADVLLVPALAVDATGARLGRGGGSFDRALAAPRRPPLVLALLYPGEMTGTLPVEDHDQRVDGVVIDGTVTLLAG